MGGVPLAHKPESNKVEQSVIQNDTDTGQSSVVQSDITKPKQVWCEIKSGRISAGKLKGLSVCCNGKFRYQVEDVYPDAGTCKLFNWETDGTFIANLSDIKVGKTPELEISITTDNNGAKEVTLLERMAACVNIPQFKQVVEGLSKKEIKTALLQLNSERDRIKRYWQVMREQDAAKATEATETLEPQLLTELIPSVEPSKLPPIDSRQYRVYSAYLKQSFEPCWMVHTSNNVWTLRHIPTGQELRIYNENDIELLD